MPRASINARARPPASPSPPIISRSLVCCEHQKGASIQAMGFGQKGGVWWFLLLAGVLLAAAVTALEDDYGNDMCDLKCEHHTVPARKQQCVDECRSRAHHHPSRAFCEMKCQHHQDPARKELCVQQCMSFGLSRHADERPHGGATVTRLEDDDGNDMCDLKCEHHTVPARRQQCVDECRSRAHHHPSRAFCEMKCQHHQDPARKELCVQQCMSFGLSRHADERPHSWATVTGAIVEVV